ncbi:MAG: hypothetical protein RLZZ249_1242 [Actinomycetota bacterium]|jgi:uncharacterized membrane protein
MRKHIAIALTVLLALGSSAAHSVESTQQTKNFQLSAFKTSTPTLSQQQRNEIRTLLRDGGSKVVKLTCTGMSQDTKARSLSIAKSMANAACSEAKRLEPSIRIFTRTKVSTSKASLRRVHLSAEFAANSSEVSKPVAPSSTLSQAITTALKTSSSVATFSLITETAPLSLKNQYLVDRFSEHLTWAARLGLEIKKPLVLIYVNSAQWMNDEIERQGCSRYTLPLGGYAIWQDCGTNSVLTRPNADAEYSAKESLDSQHGIIHEALHHWQRETVRRGLGNADYPKWVWEGGAQALSRYIYWLNSDRAKTPEQLLVDWYTIDRSDLRGMCLGVNIREMILNTPWPDKANCAYSKGQVAVDVFVELYGIDKFAAIFQTPKTPGMSDFPSHFRSITGQEIESFYDLVDNETKSRGWR